MLSLLVGAAVPATAQTATAQTQVRHPVDVSTCHPSRNVSYAGGWGAGFYPRSAYWWPSVYGDRYYQPPLRSGNPTLSIDYANNTQQVMKSIEFGLVANGNLVAEVKDVGTFSPGIEIKHQFGISPNVFPISTGLPQCMPLKVVFADGTTWTNRHLPSLKRKLGVR